MFVWELINEAINGNWIWNINIDGEDKNINLKNQTNKDIIKDQIERFENLKVKKEFMEMYKKMSSLDI